MVHRTLLQLKRARIVIPQLSPTLTQVRIHKWLKDPASEIECYEPLFVLQCSPDLLSEAYRKYKTHEPLMLIEAQDEGKLQISPEILESSKRGEWFPVGHFLGTINDDDDDDDDDDNNDAEISGEDTEWLWQAYSYEEEAETDENATDGASSDQKKVDKTAYYAPLGVIELKGLLRYRGLDVGGTTREELIERLVESDNAT
ncbi:unnamed protein product [Cylindrotheca closterium]|uniref:SAP domain-containing protein n=1 Tax=Cylindrotheca closterium TaxID=2856 RepID=A0AAD2G6R5_9STRA|nr:unnamed protein product [Cylindrotheca closterium]